MVAGEKMYLYTCISQFADFSQQTCKTFWYYVFIFVPKVENVTQKENGSRFVFNAI